MNRGAREAIRIAIQRAGEMEEDLPNTLVGTCLVNYGTGKFKVEIEGRATWDQVPSQDPIRMRKFVQKGDGLILGAHKRNPKALFVLDFFPGTTPPIVAAVLTGWFRFGFDAGRGRFTAAETTPPALTTTPADVLAALDMHAARTLSDAVVACTREEDDSLSLRRVQLDGTEVFAAALGVPGLVKTMALDGEAVFVLLESLDTVAEPHRLVKLNLADGAVLWVYEWQDSPIEPTGTKPIGDAFQYGGADYVAAIAREIQ
jgi:hypothetical protein